MTIAESIQAFLGADPSLIVAGLIAYLVIGGIVVFAIGWHE